MQQLACILYYKLLNIFKQKGQNHSLISLIIFKHLIYALKNGFIKLNQQPSHLMFMIYFRSCVSDLKYPLINHQINDKTAQ